MKRLFSKSLSLLLTVAMIISLFAGLGVSASAANGTWSGTGSSDDPYLIDDADDLKLLATNVNGGTSYSGKYFKLTADVEVSDWIPIGYKNTSYPFRGNFDGAGNTVTINNIGDLSSYYGTTCIGLFGTQKGGTIHDVTVEGTISYTRSDYAVYAGGIVGQLYGETSTQATIVNCVNNATVAANGTSSSYGGGIVGFTNSNYSYIYNCYNTGTATATKFAGGIVGYANSGKLFYCFTATDTAFGSKYATVTECYAAGSTVTTSAGYTVNWNDCADKSAWISAANASVSAYSTVTDFWSLGSDGPEHIECEHDKDNDTKGGTVDLTCTEKGYTLYTCTLEGGCGKLYKADIVDALGHSSEGAQVTTVPATCTEDGSESYVCTRQGCGKTITTVIDALDHNYDSDGVCQRTGCGFKRLEQFSDFFYGIKDDFTVTDTYEGNLKSWTVATVNSATALKTVPTS